MESWLTTKSVKEIVNFLGNLDHFKKIPSTFQEIGPPSLY